MVAGPGAAVSEAAVKHPSLAGIHFTGSTDTFQHLWSTVAANLGTYRTYPRLVGETGGKDFVLAHPSASTEALLVGLLRGSFEYQGQKCSASSRAYIPNSVWERLREPLAAATEAIPVGRSRRVQHLHGRGHRRAELSQARGRAGRGAQRPELTLVAGGECDGEVGWFVRPTILATDESAARSAAARALRADPHRLPVPGFGLGLGARPGRSHLAIRPHRARYSRTTAPPSTRRRHAFATPPATSTSTTSRQARWSVSSRSAARG